MWYNKILYNNWPEEVTMKFLLIFVALSTLGCASSPVEYGSYYGGYTGSIRTTACRPFDADELMTWATALSDGQQHSRDAEVVVRDDRVSCHTKETASSRLGKK